MINKIVKLSTVVLALLLVTGCAVNSPVAGVLYTGVTHSGIGSGGVVDNNVKSLKTGTSSCVAILGLVAIGDCSDEAARRNGGITKVSSVSHKSTSVYVFFSNYETIVTGE